MRTHGTITAARRGGPDGGLCNCPDCAPVRKKWEANRSRRQRARDRAALFAADPSRPKYPCSTCDVVPFLSSQARGRHEFDCKG